MAVERDKSRREGILLRMSTRDSVPLSKAFSAFVCFGSLSYLWLKCDYILEIKYL